MREQDLNIGIITNNLDDVKKAIKNGANVNAVTSSGTFLHSALGFFKGNIEIVKLLLNKGIEVNARNNSGWTALS